MRLNTTDGPVHLLSEYTPTLMADRDIKDYFYSQLDSIIGQYPQTGSPCHPRRLQCQGDQDAWPICLCHFGVGKTNDNGQRLLELCSYHELCITNTSFSTKPHHIVYWRHPWSEHWHQLDLIISRRSHIKGVLLTRTYHSADCRSDCSQRKSTVPNKQ